jgi:hypothetical protein
LPSTTSIVAFDPELLPPPTPPSQSSARATVLVLVVKMTRYPGTATRFAPFAPLIDFTSTSLRMSVVATSAEPMANA